MQQVKINSSPATKLASNNKNHFHLLGVESSYSVIKEQNIIKWSKEQQERSNKFLLYVRVSFTRFVTWKN